MFDEMTAAGVRATLAHHLSLSTVGDRLHGGAWGSPMCAGPCAPRSTRTRVSAPATVESTTHFLRPARADVVATARPLQVGRNTVVEVDVDTEGELCARVTQVVTAVGQKAS